MKTFIEVQGPLNESSIMDITNSQIIIKIYKKLKMIYNRIIKNKENYKQIYKLIVKVMSGKITI